MARTVFDALVQRRNVLLKNLPLYRNRPQKLDQTAEELRRISLKIGDVELPSSN